jgi:tetratricopeptide (TPR) repeat protein
MADGGMTPATVASSVKAASQSQHQHGAASQSQHSNAPQTPLTQAGAAAGPQHRGKKGHEASATLLAALTKVTEYMSDKAKAKTLLLEGKIALDKQDYIGAIECFGHGINFNPTSQDLYKMRVQCYKAMNMLSEAYFDYSFLIRLDPSNGLYYCNRALVLARMKKFEMALEDADYAVELNSNAFHYYSRGTIYSEKNMLEKAVDDYSKALQDQSSSSDTSIRIKALHTRAQSYFELNNYEAAITDATNIVTNLDSNHIAARAIVARCLKMIGELKKAEEQITNVITMENDNPSHFVERGDIR